LVETQITTKKNTKALSVTRKKDFLQVNTGKTNSTSHEKNERQNHKLNHLKNNKVEIFGNYTKNQNIFKKKLRADESCSMPA
jgi:hypothetical protein